MSRFRVRELSLVGPRRNYGVRFTDDDGEVRPLSIIAGEILTGKTSVLQFIAYCLGRNDFPRHDEIRLNVQVALLEVDVAGVIFVIERSCIERPSRTAIVHSCALAGMSEPHASAELVISPPSGDNSLSYFLLDQLGIAEIDLREAPTQDASGADRLSIRDLLRLVLVRYADLGTENLLQENRPIVRLKLEQVIDVLFGAHDNRAASIASSLKKLSDEIAQAQSNLEVVVAFLVEQRVPPREVLNQQKEALRGEVGGAREGLDFIEDQMAAVGEFGANQRDRYHAAAGTANRAASEKREISTQIERLSSLAAQYDQDVKKLVFAQEANVLFDPLLIDVCPWCMQPVRTDTAPDEMSCDVCHQPLVNDETADTSEALARELRSLRRRHNELLALLEELHTSAKSADDTYVAAAAEARQRQQALDEAMRGRFTPFIEQRDQLIESIAAATQQMSELQRLLSMHTSADRRRQELGQMRQRYVEMQREQLEAQQTSTSRDEVVTDLSRRYGELLQRFRYPKLSGARLDARFVPFARGQRYNEVGSTGAATLVTLAWFLAIFERAIEEGGPHPGLLMVDSPQKGLRASPNQGVAAPAGDSFDAEFPSQSIAEAVYGHFVEWAASDAGRGAQMIIVENSPPEVASEYVVITYTGRPDEPPYGLIEDATS